MSSGPALCASCWNRVSFWSPPCCLRCGLPQTFKTDLDQCESCVSEAFSWESCRSAVSYTSITRQLLLRLKHGRDYSVAPLLAQWLWTMHGPWVQNADYICGIPLHWTRHLKRRFNQADLLAWHLSRLSNVPLLPASLWKRHKRTASQGHLSPEARWQNVSNCFRLHPKASLFLKNKTLLLIDDVMTTGATFRACATLFRDVGVQVHVMSVARVLPSPSPESDVGLLGLSDIG